jgi:CcmD family protein
MKNLNWLFYAYGIGWLIIFGYLFQISRKESALRRKVGELRESIEERWKQKGRG